MRILSLILSLLVGACATESPPNTSYINMYEIPYTLDHPQDEYKLSKRLKEISGIALSSDEKEILAIQDEEGILFFLDANNGDIEHEFLFGEDEDYEDIARVGADVYVLSAKGQLTKINLETNVVEALPTRLTEAYDTEGLCYDAIRKELWVACKDNQFAEKKVERSRPVFAYHLKKEKVEKRPIYELKWEDILRFLETAPDNKNYNKLRDKYSDKKKNQIEPSAIAIHPKTGEVYILTATGEALLVMDRQGTILAIEHLADDIFEQPEGITFFENGDMLICSEGKKHKARIYRFEWLN